MHDVFQDAPCFREIVTLQYVTGLLKLVRHRARRGGLLLRLAPGQRVQAEAEHYSPQAAFPFAQTGSVGKVVH